MISIYLPRERARRREHAHQKVDAKVGSRALDAVIALGLPMSHCIA
jgi:hypothetical protein